MSSSSKGKASTSQGVFTRSQAPQQQQQPQTSPPEDVVEEPGADEIAALKVLIDDIDDRVLDLPSSDEFKTLNALVLSLQQQVTLLQDKVSELSRTKANKGELALGVSSEGSRKALSFPESSQLKGSSNYEQWKQALRLVLRANGLDETMVDTGRFESLSDQNQAMLLLLIRESLAPAIARSITWIETPSKALAYITEQYSQRDDATRNSLYREFHALKIGAKRSIEEFNSGFNEVLSRLTALGVNINSKDAVNQYLYATEQTYPQWAERQRSALRQAAALGHGSERLNLSYLQADLVEENRGKLTPQYQSTQQTKEKSQGDVKRRKKGKNNRIRGYGSSNGENNKNHSFYMGSFNIGPDVDSDSESSTDSCDSEYAQKPHHQSKQAGKSPKKGSRKNKGSNKGPRPSNSRKSPALLYDTGSTDHIINDRRWFSKFSPDRRGLPTLRTGGGPVDPQGSGTAEFFVKAESNKGYFIKLTLNNALYLPQCDINIVSGERHYRAGGTLIKETLYGANRKPAGALNVKKHGFFLTLKGHTTPKACIHSYCHASIRREPENPVFPLIVEIPETPDVRPEEYVNVPPSRTSSPQPEPKKRKKGKKGKKAPKSSSKGPQSAEKSGENNRPKSPVIDLDRADRPIIQTP